MAWLDDRLWRQAYLMGKKVSSAEDAIVYNALSVHVLGEKLLQWNMDKHVNISRWYKEMHAAARGDTDSWPATVRRGMSGSASALFNLTIDRAQCDELKADWAQGYIRYASYLFRQERLADAMLAYETGMELDPSSDSAREGLEKCIEVTLYQIFHHGDWLKLENKGGNEVSFIEIPKNTLRYTGLSSLFSARNRLRRFGTTFARLEEFLSHVEIKDTSSDTPQYYFPGLDETTWRVVVGRLVGPERALDPSSFWVSGDKLYNSPGEEKTVPTKYSKEPHDVVLPIEEVELKYIPGPKTRHGIRVPKGKPNRFARKLPSPAGSPVSSDRLLQPSHDFQAILTPDDKHRLLVTQQKAREQRCFRQIERQVERQNNDEQLKQIAQERGEVEKETSLSSELDTILKQRARQGERKPAEMLLNEQKEQEEQLKAHIREWRQGLEKQAADQKRREEEKAQEAAAKAEEDRKAAEEKAREAERIRLEKERIAREQEADGERRAREQEALDQEVQITKERLDIDWRKLAENFDQTRQGIDRSEERRGDGRDIGNFVSRNKFKIDESQFHIELQKSFQSLQKKIAEATNKEKCCVLIVLKVMSNVYSLCDSVNDLKKGFEILMVYAQLLSELAADEGMIGDYFLGCLASEKEFQNNDLGHSFPWLFLDGIINKDIVRDKIATNAKVSSEGNLKLEKGITKNAFLFAAFMQAKPAFRRKRHYRGISNVWVYMHDLITREDRESYHIFGIKYAVLIAGHALQREYGRSNFEKLMKVIRNEYLNESNFRKYIEQSISLTDIAQGCRDMLDKIFFEDKPKEPGTLYIEDQVLYLNDSKDAKVFVNTNKREYSCHHLKLGDIEHGENPFLSFGSLPYAHFNRWPRDNVAYAHT